MGQDDGWKINHRGFNQQEEAGYLLRQMTCCVNVGVAQQNGCNPGFQE